MKISTFLILYVKKWKNTIFISFFCGLITFFTIKFFPYIIFLYKHASVDGKLNAVTVIITGIATLLPIVIQLFLTLEKRNKHG
jgi:hypothetical protein